MQNGIAIIEKTDTKTEGFFIDQDTIEFARLNAKAKKRIAQAEAQQRKANHNRRKAEKAEAQRKAYTQKSVAFILSSCAVCGASVWAGMAGMIHPIIFIPVAITSLCVACVRFGAWVGRLAK